MRGRFVNVRMHVHTCTGVKKNDINSALLQSTEVDVKIPSLITDCTK